MLKESTTRSRIYNNNYRKKRKKSAIKSFLVSIFAIALAVFIAMFGHKSGQEIGKKINKIKYPVKYSEFITKYANENNLDPYLVIAVIRQESNFVADARSEYAGGLMQLTETTAAEYAKKLGLENYNYMDPETNIKIGCFVLSSLIKKYENVDTALAAYNAGVGNVDSWLKNPDYSNDGKTLYDIPFPETRHYVKKVNQYIEIYKNQTDLQAEEGKEEST